MPSLPDPVDRECLPCYLYRVAGTEPCVANLRALMHYRDYSAPRATALERKIKLLGGFCDCEVLLNVFRPLPMRRRAPWTRGWTWSAKEHAAAAFNPANSG